MVNASTDCVKKDLEVDCPVTGGFPLHRSEKMGTEKHRIHVKQSSLSRATTGITYITDPEAGREAQMP